MLTYFLITVIIRGKSQPVLIELILNLRGVRLVPPEVLLEVLPEVLPDVELKLEKEEKEKEEKEDIDILFITGSISISGSLFTLSL